MSIIDNTYRGKNRKVRIEQVYDKETWNLPTVALAVASVTTRVFLSLMLTETG